ncbi:hypothetical protein BEWA_035220 [Theileria equi strain WA]|uniref:Fcf2 pre-rRNA processing C-terminal domain-containing protein n=1 Tax=Theileria equi strain WA TaxID=1537102 RepID=L1LDQ3_THEEQ|nr:hypothetical protein BEWA_035220 [Theileria equi strain WA]EKX73486.1 hypothetical protein BEWA_035220 [Theileria equi strain WA]|eukprot:XP_004832938.1 hypothetical protein BEWA_035220 [Theileria equi strain WA]
MGITPSEEDLVLIEYGSVHSRALWDLMTQISTDLETSSDHGKEDTSSSLEQELGTNIDLKKHLDTQIHFSSHPPNVNRRVARSKVSRISHLSRGLDTEQSQEILREWRAIQLRGFVDPKKFYSGNKRMEELPEEFHIGVIRSGNGIRAGPGNESQALGTFNSKKRNHGKSLVSQILLKNGDWAKKRYRELQGEYTQGKKGWYERFKQKRKIGKRHAA